MGYDVSFHPISPDEIQEWYFTPLTWIQQGQEEKVLALATQYGIEDFYAEKYLDTLRVGAETESNELFDKSHGFYIAVIQGFFRDYYYTRGCFTVTSRTNNPLFIHYFSLPFPVIMKKVLLVAARIVFGTEQDNFQFPFPSYAIMLVLLLPRPERYRSYIMRALFPSVARTYCSLPPGAVSKQHIRLEAAY